LKAQKPAAKPGTRRYAPRMPPEERRTQLLDATLSLIAERGYESVSMEGIARAAGVTKPVVYDLFGTLADLLEALLEREEERALLQLAELMPTPRADADPEEVLVDGLNAFLRSVEARPDAWRLILTPTETMPGRVREVVESQRTQIAAQLESIVRWGLEQLTTEIEDVELLVETIIVMVENAARQHLDDPERYTTERLTEFTSSLLASVKR
jgi:AcrR family transcriptional regulator